MSDTEIKGGAEVEALVDSMHDAILVVLNSNAERVAINLHKRVGDRECDLSFNFHNDQPNPFGGIDITHLATGTPKFPE